MDVMTKIFSSCTVEKVFFVFYPHTLTFCCNRLTDSNKGCEGKKRKTFFYKKMNIHRHRLYIIRTFFLDITLLASPMAAGS